MIQMLKRTLAVCLNRRGNQFNFKIVSLICLMWQYFKIVSRCLVWQCYYVSRYGVNKLEAALSPLVKIGLKSILIFGVPTKANKVDHS